MVLGNTFDCERISNIHEYKNELWPLDPVDPKNARFPCCIVWTPLPVISWLVPYIGHVGICCEDGRILDFSGSSLVNVDNFAYGAVARYLQLDRQQCCFPRSLATHTCRSGYRHSERGTAICWDDALDSSMQQFQHKSYNLFTCNCHSFLASCLNRLSYDGSLQWNMVNIAILILWKGVWVNWIAVVRSFLPFALVLFIGSIVAGKLFCVGMLIFSIILIGWFIIWTYCSKNLKEC